MKQASPAPQLWAIKIISEMGLVKTSDLAHRMYLHPATVTGIINRLEAIGLIKRVRTNEDRRVVRIELTADGKNLVTKAPQVAQGLLVEGLEALTQKKLQEMASSLDTLVYILGAQELPPQLILSSEINLPKKRGAKKTVT